MTTSSDQKLGVLQPSSRTAWTGSEPDFRTSLGLLTSAAELKSVIEIPSDFSYRFIPFCRANEEEISYEYSNALCCEAYAIWKTAYCEREKDACYSPIEDKRLMDMPTYVSSMANYQDQFAREFRKASWGLSIRHFKMLYLLITTRRGQYVEGVSLYKFIFAFLWLGPPNLPITEDVAPAHAAVETIFALHFTRSVRDPQTFVPAFAHFSGVLLRGEAESEESGFATRLCEGRKYSRRNRLFYNHRMCVASYSTPDMPEDWANDHQFGYNLLTHTLHNTLLHPESKYRRRASTLSRLSRPPTGLMSVTEYQKQRAKLCIENGNIVNTICDNPEVIPFLPPYKLDCTTKNIDLSSVEKITPAAALVPCENKKS